MRRVLLWLGSPIHWWRRQACLPFGPNQSKTLLASFALDLAAMDGSGRGADLIIIDDPLKADDALSEPRRRSVNEWYDNTLRSRLNSQEKGAIIIVMQRLHADDLVAHVQQTERWDVLSFPAIAEQDETYHILTPYGRRKIQRKAGEILQPDPAVTDDIGNSSPRDDRLQFCGAVPTGPATPPPALLSKESG
jgi:hypothetical protein